MWKSFFKAIAAIYFCLFLAVALDILIALKYGGASAYTEGSFLGNCFSLFVYISMISFPIYLLIPVTYHLIVYHNRIVKPTYLVLLAGVVGAMGEWALLGINYFRSTHWTLDILALGVVGLVYGFIHVSWVRKGNTQPID